MAMRKEEPYIRWYVSGLRRRKTIEISRRNWLARMMAVAAIWVAVTMLLGLAFGVDGMIIGLFFGALLGGGLAFHGWYTGRENVGKAPKPLLRMKDAESEGLATAWPYRSSAAEMAPVVVRILEGRQETPIYYSTEAWLAYLLCINERSVTRKELIEKAKSLDIPVPAEVEIDWAFEHLKARGWLHISFAIEDARRDGWNGEFVCRMRTGVKRRLAGIMGDLSVFRDAHRKLNDWLSVHPPDSASEETVLAYALYLSESPISLAKVLEEMDAVNIGIPNPYILGAAFLRLRKRGWLVVEGENAYGLTPEARQFMDTLVTRRTYMGGPDEHLREWMKKNPPPEYETDPIGDSFEEDIEEMMGALQTRGLLKPVKKGRRERV